MSHAPEPATRADDVVVIVPIKPPARGKSRLGPLPDDVRRALATAFALDTLAAAKASGVTGILAVTDDAALASRLVTAGHVVIPDGATGLNESLRQAAAEAVRRWPDTRPVALLADLPCLTPADLTTAVAALPARPAFVRDHHGTGTTLYSARLEEFAPCFGHASASAHVQGGAWEVVAAVPTLRLDVDNAADLARAFEVGVGAHTSRAAAGMTRAGHPIG